MKFLKGLLIILTLVTVACKTTTPPQSLTIDGMTLTLPEGFKEFQKDNAMSFDGIPALQNWYEKRDGGNTATLKITRFDVAHMEKDDPDYVTEMCLSQQRVFYSENHEDTYKYSESLPLSISGKKGYVLTYDDNTNPNSHLKGEMIAVKCGSKVMVLNYTDFNDHFEKAKGDWDAIKSSIKVN